MAIVGISAAVGTTFAGGGGANIGAPRELVEFGVHSSAATGDAAGAREERRDRLDID
jgi:hypothetical protein